MVRLRARADTRGTVRFRALTVILKHLCLLQHWHPWDHGFEPATCRKIQATGTALRVREITPVPSKKAELSSTTSDIRWTLGSERRTFYLTNQPTNQPTPLSTVLPEKPTGPHLVKKLSAFYNIRMFIHPFRSLSYNRSIDSSKASCLQSAI
jgi:hypothetical protein